MALEKNDGTFPYAPRYADLRQGKLVSSKSVPYGNRAECMAAIPVAYRCEGLVVKIWEWGFVKTFQFTENYADGELKEVSPFKSLVGAVDGEFFQIQEQTFIQGFVYQGDGTPVLNITARDIVGDGPEIPIVQEWDTAYGKSVAVGWWCDVLTGLSISGIPGIDAQNILIIYR